MNALALTVVLVFWTPVAVVTIYNLFWDLRFWQMKDYRFDRMVQHLRWDFALTHRRPEYTVAKLILFAVLLSFAVIPGSIAPVVAVLVTFSLWVAQVFNIGEQLFSHKFPYLDLTLRNVGMLITGVVVLALPPMLLSLYLLSANPPELSTAGVSLLPMITPAGNEVLPLTYIFLIFSSLLAIVYDLGSPVVSTVLVVISSPIAWLEQAFYVWVAKLFLKYHPKLITIAVTGSFSKTTTREILSYILSRHYQVAGSELTETSLRRLAMSVITNMKPQTQVFIAEINAYRPAEMTAMTKLLHPQIAILTGIDPSHIALFGSQERTLDTKSEIVRQMDARGTVIYNGDDQLLTTIAGKYSNKEVFFYIHHDPHDELIGNQLEVDDYHVSGIETKYNRLTMVVHNQTQEVEMSLPAEAKSVLTSVIAAIAGAVEAGVHLDAIAASLTELPPRTFTPELLDGDNNTLLINDERALTLKGLKNLLEYLTATAAPRKLLVTTGIAELGKYKRDLYKQIAPDIRAAADVVITSDRHLAEALQQDNSDIEVIVVDRVDELIYSVRTSAEPNAAILLAGSLDPAIVAALRYQ